MESWIVAPRDLKSVLVRCGYPSFPVIGATLVFIASSLLGADASLAQDDISGVITDSITRNVTEDVGRNVEAKLFKPTLTVERSSGAIRGQSISADGRYLSLIMADGTVRFWDLELGVQRPTLQPKVKAQFVQPSPDGKTIAVGSDGTLALYDVGARKEVGKLAGAMGAVRSAAFAPGGSILVTGADDGSVAVWDVDKRVAKIVMHASGAVGAVAISPDGNLAAAGTGNGTVDVWSTGGGKVVQSIDRLPAGIVYLQFSANGRQLYVGTSAGTLGRFDLSASRMDRTVSSPDKSSVMAVNRSSVVAFGSADGQVDLLDLETGKEVKKLDAHKGVVKFVAFGGAADRLITSGDDGVLRLWDSASGEKLVEVVTTAQGWAVIDRQGRFDGSEQGMNDVGWHAGGRDILLENLAEQFFEPGLLAQYLDSDSGLATKAPANIREGIALPPKVEIDLPDAPRTAGMPFIIIVIATDQGGGIDTVRLYHNGKLVQPGSLTQQREVEVKGQRVRAAAFQVKPVPGPNNFRAVATGLWGIEGQSERVTETFAGEGPLPTLHVLAVGINKYSDPKLTLGYSVPDAKSIVDQLRRASKGVFAGVDVQSLFDSQATRPNILHALNALEGVDANDVVVVYLAGHGTVVGKDWIFLPHEAKFQKKFADYRKGAVTAQEIQDALVEAKAQRVLVLIDSCQSGATVETFEQMQSFQRRYIRSFSRTAGVTIIAASRRDQEAIELPSLGHGLFTYVVLQGLDGSADNAPKDGNVTAHEIVQYADLQIPGMSKRYLDEPQVPMAFALGADFRLRAK